MTTDLRAIYLIIFDNDNLIQCNDKLSYKLDAIDVEKYQYLFVSYSITS